jgi:NADH-quinone oxidoreductase subunit F
VGADIFGSGFSLDVVVHPGAGAYICGEETALLESLEGKRGFPRIKPPFFPAVIGLYGEPTVVNNVETMSNIPWIITNGGAAFAALGEGRSTGTRLFALAGHVRNPGVYELEMVKTTFRDLIYDPVLGGGIRRQQLKAFIPGGVSAPWFGPTSSTCRSARTRWARPARCSARARSWSWTRHLRGAGRLAHHQVLLPRVVRPVHAVPRGLGLARADHVRESRTGRDARRRSRPAHGPVRQHLARRGLAAAADDHLRARPVDPLVDRLGIRMFRDEFLVHVKEGGCPFD